jgi:hypothetical protein
MDAEATGRILLSVLEIEPQLLGCPDTMLTELSQLLNLISFIQKCIIEKWKKGEG